MRVVEKYGVRKYMKFKHRAVAAKWNETTSKWHVKFERTDTGETVEDVGDVFITATGALNQWKWPDIKGLESFKGPKLHSANWDEGWDHKVRTLEDCVGMFN
jgi:cation diffusion facilitator CzcD-associated flavoprotein CzcO